jgi:hypothetical protein
MLCLAMLLAGCGEAGPNVTASASPMPFTPRTTPSAPNTTPSTPRTTPSASRTTSAARLRSHPVRSTPTPRFEFRASTLTPTLRRQLSATSWHPGCPVGLQRLRYLRISYWGFDQRAHLGEMVLNASAVQPTQRAFAALFAARFPIRRMRLVDRYGGSDYASIQADNTSAFNCRDATGASRWSEHAFGLAIDVNPIENPYVYANGTTTHAASDPYLDRSNVRPGMAVPGEPSSERSPRSGGVGADAGRRPPTTSTSLSTAVEGTARGEPLGHHTPLRGRLTPTIMR